MEQPPDPVLAAARDALDLALTQMRTSIEDAPPEALNWQPGLRDTNSLAALTAHALGSTRSWLSIAVGVPLPARDRESEFAVTADDAVSLLRLFDDVAADCRRLLAEANAVDWALLRRTHPRPRPDAPTEVSAAWALLHAIEHLREHEGQMFLTRQLWDQERDATTNNAGSRA